MIRRSALSSVTHTSHVSQRSLLLVISSSSAALLNSNSASALMSVPTVTTTTRTTKRWCASSTLTTSTTSSSSLSHSPPPLSSLSSTSAMMKEKAKNSAQQQHPKQTTKGVAAPSPPAAAAAAAGVSNGCSSSSSKISSNKNKNVTWASAAAAPVPVRSLEGLLAKDQQHGLSMYGGFAGTMTARAIIDRYSYLKAGESTEDEAAAAAAGGSTAEGASNVPTPLTHELSAGVGQPLPSLHLPRGHVRVGGRVISVRDMGKVVFITIRSDGHTIQIAANVQPQGVVVGGPTQQQQQAGDQEGSLVTPPAALLFPTKQALEEKVTRTLRPGDIIGVAGPVMRSKKGELTVVARSAFALLAPYVCSDVAMCPDQRSFSTTTPPVAAPTNTNTSTTRSNNKNIGGGKRDGKLQQQGKDTESSSFTSPSSSSSSSVLSDPDLRYRHRFLDMIARPQTHDVYRIRHRLLRTLREHLDDRLGFTEVETPMFHSVACGANAKPFLTHHNANQSDLFLRIAPELYLKQCVVGGLERVYEIGKVFRNEDADKSHNPEFTSCEFYMAYANYSDLMTITEDILRRLAIAANKLFANALSASSPSSSSTAAVENDLCYMYVPNNQKSEADVAADTTATTRAATPIRINLNTTFRRVSVLDELERQTSAMFPHVHELDSSFGIAFMAAIMIKHQISPPTIRTAAKMLDKLIDHFITDPCVDPVFVCDHPLFMSPLAKEHDGSCGVAGGESKSGGSENTTNSTTDTNTLPFPVYSVRHGTSGLSERFELFINGMEICNAYSELNHPAEQFKRFEQQLRDKDKGDDEAMALDEGFLKALQCGLPPCAGWGMGIDRVVMLLTQSETIRDVILFPLLKPQMDLNNRRRSKAAGSFCGFINHSTSTMFYLTALETELKKRGDRFGVEQIISAKKLVQQCSVDAQTRRRHMLTELDRVFAMQREQFALMFGSSSHNDNTQSVEGDVNEKAKGIKQLDHHTAMRRLDENHSHNETIEALEREQMMLLAQVAAAAVAEATATAGGSRSSGTTTKTAVTPDHHQHPTSTSSKNNMPYNNEETKEETELKVRMTTVNDHTVAGNSSPTPTSYRPPASVSGPRLSGIITPLETTTRSGKGEQEVDKELLAERDNAFLTPHPSLVQHLPAAPSPSEGPLHHHYHQQHYYSQQYYSQDRLRLLATRHNPFWRTMWSVCNRLQK